MKLKEHKNSKKQGDAGLGVAIGWFASNGYTVCVPLTDSQGYDLIVDDGTGLKRVQVKTSTYRREHFEVELRTKGGNRTGWGKTKKMNRAEVDLLFIVTGDECRYLIPMSATGCVTGLRLGPTYDQYKV